MDNEYVNIATNIGDKLFGKLFKSNKKDKKEEKEEKEEK